MENRFLSRMLFYPAKTRRHIRTPCHHHEESPEQALFPRCLSKTLVECLFLPFFRLSSSDRLENRSASHFDDCHQMHCSMTRCCRHLSASRVDLCPCRSRFLPVAAAVAAFPYFLVLRCPYFGELFRGSQVLIAHILMGRWHVIVTLSLCVFKKASMMSNLLKQLYRNKKAQTQRITIAFLFRYNKRQKARDIHNLQSDCILFRTTTDQCFFRL